MRNRLVLIGLMASLVLNAFLIGYGVTLINRQPLQRMIDPEPTELALRVADLLPEAQGEILRARVRSAAPEMLAMLRDYRRSVAEIAALLAQENVDRAALATALDTARTARSAMGRMLTETFVEVAAELPPDARRALLQRFKLR